jgi:tetratricopeptide (TPR) repeat protein
MDNTCKEDVLRKVLVRPHLKSFVDHANDMSWNNTAEFVVITIKKDQFLYSTSDMPTKEAVKSLELLHSIFLELDLSDERRCDILANLGFYYMELECDQDAGDVLRKAYSMTEDKVEEEWLLLRCRISFYLARTYHSMDSVGPAIEMMKTSIDLAKKIYMKEEDKIMERYFRLSSFCFSWKKFWKLGTFVEEATQFLSSCAPDSETLSRARCLDYLSRVYGYYEYIESFYKPPFFRKYKKLREELINKSLNIYEHVLGADVSTCPEYCVLLAESAILKLEANPTEARTQLEKALEYCSQNGDKFNHSWIAARKKHLFDNSTWWRKLCYGIGNLKKGRILLAEEINMCDDVLEDCNSGRIAPSPRMIVPIKSRRNNMVCAGKCVLGCYISWFLFIVMFGTIYEEDASFVVSFDIHDACTPHNSAVDFTNDNMHKLYTYIYLIIIHEENFRNVCLQVCSN